MDTYLQQEGRGLSDSGRLSCLGGYIYMLERLSKPQLLTK